MSEGNNTLTCNGLTVVADTSKEDIVVRMLDIFAGNPNREFIVSCEERENYSKTKHTYHVRSHD